MALSIVTNISVGNLTRASGQAPDVASAGNVVVPLDADHGVMTGGTAVDNLFGSSSTFRSDRAFGSAYTWYLQDGTSFTAAGNIKAAAGARAAGSTIRLQPVIIGGVLYHVET